MKTRMNANSLSAWEAMQKTLSVKQQQVINVFRNDPTREMDSYQVADRLRMPNGDIKPRLTELYQMNWLKIVGVGTFGKRKRNLYKLRMPNDPDNVIEKSPIEILQDKLTAVMEGVGLTESDVNAFHRNWIEQQIKDKAEAEQFIDDAIKRVEAADAERQIDTKYCCDCIHSGDLGYCLSCKNRSKFERISHE